MSPSGSKGFGGTIRQELDLPVCFYMTCPLSISCTYIRHILAKITLCGKIFSPTPETSGMCRHPGAWAHRCSTIFNAQLLRSPLLVNGENKSGRPQEGFSHVKPVEEYVTFMHVPLVRTSYTILPIFKWGWQCVT